jgi:excisionase family DNA binding protein
MAIGVPSDFTGAQPKVLSVNEFRECFGLGRTTIYKAIGNGNIRIIKCGSRTLIPIAETENFLERLQATSNQGGGK